MRLLAIDQSFTCTGLAVLEEGELIHTAVFNTSKEDNIVDRAHQVATYVCCMIQKHNIDRVAIEGLAFGMRGNATRDLAGLQFVVIAYIKHKEGLQVNIISPKTVKKVATGSGKATKLEMFEALPKKIKEHIGERYLKTKGRYDVTDSYYIGIAALNETKKG